MSLEVERSLRLAAQMQADFTREDFLLRREAEHLRSTAGPQVTFECVLCMDDHPDDDLARIEKCGHKFCRDGLREYIRTRIKASRYPIMCPVCTASDCIDASEAGGLFYFTTIECPSNVSSVISQELIHDIGISEEEYATYVEMELNMHSVVTHCRQ